MAKRKPKKQVEEITVTQDVVRTDVQGNSFDMLFRFTKGSDTVEFFMDELVKTILEGLLDKYGKIVLKVNWWADGLMVIAPDTIPDMPVKANDSPTDER